MQIRALSALAASAAFAVVASAGPINYISAERYLQGDASIGGGTSSYALIETTGQPYVGTTSLGAFDETLAYGIIAYTDVNGELIADAGADTTGSQTSYLDGNTIDITGRSQIDTGPPLGTSFARVTSGCLITFEIAEDTGYSIAFSASNNVYGDFTLTGPGGGTVFDKSADLVTGANIGVTNYTQSGTLAAGTYTLFLRAAGDEGSFAYFDFSMDVVPAPASAGLLALGGLVATRRRR